MQKFFALAGLAAMCILAQMASDAGAAPIGFHRHDSGSGTQPDQVCGIDGTSTFSFVDNFQAFADGTTKDQFTSDVVFTSTATGKSVELFNSNQVTGSNNPIDNGNGTVTFAPTFK